MLRIRTQMDEERPCDQVNDCCDCIINLKWSFCSNHSHNSGETIRVAHVGCNMYVDEMTE